LTATANEDGSGGMAFVATKQGNKVSTHIQVNIAGNKMAKIADNANEITNIFVHENKHYQDFKEVGFDKYRNTSKNIREQRAVQAQMDHPSFEKTRPWFQEASKNYGRQFGLVIPIQPKKP
jgi:hypothetical protein